MMEKFCLWIWSQMGRGSGLYGVSRVNLELDWRRLPEASVFLRFVVILFWLTGIATPSMIIEHFNRELYAACGMIFNCEYWVI